MKRTRKGFTLIELLIVIAIVGALAASMTMTGSRATGAAKAATIVSSVGVCKTAANVYYTLNNGIDLSSKTAADFMTADYIPNFSGFSSGVIQISADKTGTGYKGWAVNVDYSKDGASSDITAALSAVNGYSGVDGKGGKFKVTLWNGTIGSITAASDGN